MAVVSKHGYKIPVEDWQRGKEMTPGEIRGLAAWAFRRGREAQKEVTEAEHKYIAYLEKQKKQ